MSLFVRYCCIARWLFASFLEPSRVSGNTNPWFTLSFLIIITMPSNNSSIFCSSLNFLHIDLLSRDGGTTTWTIFMCLLLVRFTWQAYCRDSFQLQSFLRDSKKPFCNTFSFSERKFNRPVNSPGATGSFPVLTDFAGSAA